jgi:hypothetical protein
MEINWKVVAPISLIVGAMVLYFVRVKPIEGLENADKQFATKVKESLATIESTQKFYSDYKDKAVKKLDTEDYKELLKKTNASVDVFVSASKMRALEDFILKDGGSDDRKAFENHVKEIDFYSKVRDYARDSLSVLNGTDGQGSGMNTSGGIDNSSGSSPSLW